MNPPCLLTVLMDSRNHLALTVHHRWLLSVSYGLLELLMMKTHRLKCLVSYMYIVLCSAQCVGEYGRSE